MIFFRFICLFLLIFVLEGVSAQEKNEVQKPLQESVKSPTIDNSSTWVAHLIRDKNVNQRISDLLIKEGTIPVTMIFKDQKFRPLVQIPIEFARPGWSVFIQEKFLAPISDQPGSYKLFAYLNDRVNEVEIVVRGPKKEIERERVYIVSPDAQEYKIVSPWDALRLGLGSALISYKQTGYNSYQAWTGVLAVQFHSPEEKSKFGLISDLSMTALTVSSSNGLSPQLLQFNGDIIYFFHWSPNSRWRKQALVGLDYFTMLSNGAPFGFKDLVTPEVGGRARYIVNEKEDIIFELRYSPLSGISNFKERGYIVSYSRSWLLPNLHRVEAGIRLLDFTYQSNPNITASAQTLSLLLSYSL
ncbi:MAG: hypothetical protein J0M15_06020 [Deltaproteobacteria bacterium]|nr:hypothetical protein [Deltaproteobacteria bacterium]